MNKISWQLDFFAEIFIKFIIFEIIGKKLGICSQDSILSKNISSMEGFEKSICLESFGPPVVNSVKV